MTTQIRFNVFETNSSSVHAFAFINEEAYQQWKNGGYIDLRDLKETDYADTYDETYADISENIVSHNGIGRIRKELPQERYYNHPDDCLLEAGIFPYNSCSDEKTGTPSTEWAQRCGGLNCLKVEPVEEGYRIYANWYAWN